MTNKADNIVRLFPRHDFLPDRAPPFDAYNPSHVRAWEDMWEFAREALKARRQLVQQHLALATEEGLGQ